MQIHELDALGTVTSTDLLAMDTGSATYKSQAAALAAYVINNHTTSSLFGSILKVKDALQGAYSWLLRVDAAIDAINGRMLYANNSTETIGTASRRTVEPAFITSGNTVIYMGVTVPKLMTNVGNVTVTKLIGRFRGPSGTLNSESSDVDYYTSSAYNIGAVIAADNRVVITVTASTAFTNSTNNSPVSFHGQIGLKFTT